MEMVASKEEMLERQYTEEFGSGTALLLRLTEPWKGSSRVVLADSAFASVKSAHSLMQKRGLHFIGMVKTAHRSYPRAFLNAKLKEAERGQTEALGCDFSGTRLHQTTSDCCSRRCNPSGKCGRARQGAGDAQGWHACAEACLRANTNVVAEFTASSRCPTRLNHVH